MVRVDSGDVVETLPVRRAVQRFSRCIFRGVVLFPFADNHVSTDEFQTMLYSLVWLGYAFFPTPVHYTYAYCSLMVGPRAL